MATTPAGKKKNAARGARKIIDWGTVKKKVSGKTVSTKVYSRVIGSVVTTLGMKPTDPKKIAGATAKKDKKGRLRLSGVSITKSGSRVILCSNGEMRKTKKGQEVKVFHRVPVPPQISLAKAVAVLSRTKVKFIKIPNGFEYAIGRGR